MTNRIRELRKQRGLTMKQLGAMFGLAESTISQYENGRRQPDNSTLLRLSEFFDVTVGYLLGAEKNAHAITDKRATNEDIKLSVIEIELIRKFRRLDERGKSAVLNALDHEYATLPGSTAAPAYPKQA